MSETEGALNAGEQKDTRQIYAYCFGLLAAAAIIIYPDSAKHPMCSGNIAVGGAGIRRGRTCS